MALRCKLSGHDRDACGVCRRCGDAEGAEHDWRKEQERARPCFEVESCSRCGETRERPDHDWTPTPADTLDGTGIEMKCSRCGLKI